MTHKHLHPAQIVGHSPRVPPVSQRNSVRVQTLNNIGPADLTSRSRVRADLPIAR